MWHKYGAKRTTIEGITFDSIGESQYYQELKLQESLKLIKFIELQPKVYLTDARILYKPDFLIEEMGKLIYVDFKGMSTPSFNIKARLWKHYGPGKLRIVIKKGKKFIIKKEIDAILK